MDAAKPASDITAVSTGSAPHSPPPPDSGVVGLPSVDYVTLLRLGMSISLLCQSLSPTVRPRILRVPKHILRR